MEKSRIDFTELNMQFSIDKYLNLNDSERLTFRVELRTIIKELQNTHTLKLMTKDDVYLAGIKQRSRIRKP